MTEFNYPEIAEYKVICATENCENFGIEILIMANAENPYVICGPCENQIENVSINEV
jgi:hypothetical protein